MNNQTAETIFKSRISNPLLNTSYPLRVTDWAPYRVNSTLSFDTTVPLSFYLHIPFCQHLCRFCEYTRTSLPKEDRQRHYLDVLAHDISSFLDEHPDTVLRGFDIGGGTPTALSDDNFRYLMQIFADTVHRVHTTDDFEPSIEGTFLTLNPSKLEAIVQAGIHRLSLGIQTSSSSILRAQGRKDVSLTDMKRILDEAHDAGIHKINLDLMYGLSGQDEASRQRDLDVIRFLAPEQVTLYELRTNMLHDVQWASKEELYASYCSYYDALIEMGYHADFGQNTFSCSATDFGVSSYLRSRMFEGAPYRGFGISAQSMSPIGIAYNPGKNEHALSDYLSRSTFSEDYHYALPPEELLSKYIAIAAYSGGFSLTHASRILGHDATQWFRNELDFCLSNGLLSQNGDRIQITRKGFLHYGAVFSLFYLHNFASFTRQTISTGDTIVR
jgi:oxygen-independent coproporphyrinogen-3 oxidase